MAKKPIDVDVLRHDGAKRRNIPTAEFEPVLREEDRSPIRLAYERRNRDLDPQLVWRGKDEQDWSDLVVAAPPLFIQEKVHPKVLIDDLLRQSRSRRGSVQADIPDLFADFNGLPDAQARCEFYAHDQNWSNRMILGDSLQVMASLAEREGLRGKVQCIYLDPPYGIKFNSNFQWSTTSRDVKDGNAAHITREPEQVKAFRDTWRDGIHSYLTYLRDRLTVARDLLADTGSIFVQIGDENVHRVRALMDEVFGDDNFISLVTFKKTHYQESDNVANIADYLLIFARVLRTNKHRKAFRAANLLEVDYSKYTRAFTPAGVQVVPKEWRNDPSQFEEGWRPFRSDITLTQEGDSGNSQVPWTVAGKTYLPGAGRHWRTHESGRQRLCRANRVNPSLSRPFYIEGYNDSPSTYSSNIWTDDLAGAQGKICVVQPSSGGGGGSPSTPPASPSPWHGPGSWARATPGTSWPTAPRASARSGRSPGSRRRRRCERPKGARQSRLDRHGAPRLAMTWRPSRRRRGATSATASSTSGCRTSRSSPSPTTPRST